MKYKFSFSFDFLSPLEGRNSYFVQPVNEETKKFTFLMVKNTYIKMKIIQLH